TTLHTTSGRTDRNTLEYLFWFGCVGLDVVLQSIVNRFGFFNTSDMCRLRDKYPSLLMALRAITKL
ncbi:hypothetical protein MD588_21855, partial [Photobacterium sp. SDRW27]|uniref:hypothetical protein n=1 Tax=Photobacterium obscurum TaxID=2829490 RepID=UPI00224359BF